MRVLVLKDGEFYEKEIENTLKALQNEVNGRIEIPSISNKFRKNKIDIIINEEGKSIEGINKEIAVMDDKGRLIDIVYGNVVFASHDNKGNTIGLTDDQIDFIETSLARTVIITINNSVLLLRALLI